MNKVFNLLTSLVDQYSFLNVFKYLTFRTGLSVITSLIVVFIIGGPLIKIFSEKMIMEYERWGYPKQRLLIGGLQFLGGLGLLVGLYFKPLIPLSSASLLLFMLSAIGVRIKIKDQPLMMLPAIFYATINFIVLINYTF